MSRVHGVSLSIPCLLPTASAALADRPSIYCIQGTSFVPAPGVRLEDARVVPRYQMIHIELDKSGRLTHGLEIAV